MSRFVVGLTAIFFLPLLASPQVRFGAEVNYGSDRDFGFGIRSVYPLPGIKKGFDAVGSFNYFFWDDGLNVSNVEYTFWEVNFNGVLNINSGNKMFIPFVGAGLNLAFASVRFDNPGKNDVTFSDTDQGLNLVGGSRFSVSTRFTPYAEARITLGGSSQFVLTGGILF